jgi:DNA primase
VHQNAQRLLKPFLVANPYARELTFLDSQTRTRRDHMKYLALIRSIALLHQHQRPRKTVTHRGQALEYIEVTLDDIAMANRLAHEVLGRSLDELPPQTKRLLLLTDEMVSAECERRKMEREDFRFSRKDVRKFTKWSDSQLKRHLHRLEELEYLLVHHGGRGQSFAYELVFERQGDSGKPMLPGLIEMEKLTGYAYDAPGSKGRSPGQVCPKFGGCPGVVRVKNRQYWRGEMAKSARISKKSLPGRLEKIVSYTQPQGCVDGAEPNHQAAADAAESHGESHR